MKYSQVKQVKTFCESLHSTPDYREVVGHIESNSDDFEVDNVRFINFNYIDQVQQDELSSDEYILGCFNASFIADIIEIDVNVIEAMQKAEAFEAIGKLIISMGKLEELQEAYAKADGYGHHFNRYDGNEEVLDLSIDGCATSDMYHVFDNH